MPQRYGMPPGMSYALIVEVLGWPPPVVDSLPIELVDKIMEIKNIKAVMLGGGEYLV